jgi:hypothetical protein
MAPKSVKEKYIPLKMAKVCKKLLRSLSIVNGGENGEVQKL